MYWAVARDQHGCPRCYGHADSAAGARFECQQEVREYQKTRPDLRLTVGTPTRHDSHDAADYDDAGPRTGA